jgi:hypothetical protein
VGSAAGYGAGRCCRKSLPRQQGSLISPCAAARRRTRSGASTNGVLTLPGLSPALPGLPKLLAVGCRDRRYRRISNELIHGPIPAADFNGLQVWGSYANALVIHANFLPAGYVVVLATGGPNAEINPVGFREHVNPAYQGLRHIPGSGPYPIVDSFFARGFGVGAGHRGAAVVTQITTNTSFTPPVIPT